MSRLILTITATMVIAFGCSHTEGSTAETDPKLQRSVPPPPQKLTARPATAARAHAPEQSKQKEENAVFFDFDSALLRDDARPVLQKFAEKIREGRVALNIEGHCDEMGTVEYNLALGEQRANATKEYLVHMGLPPHRISTVSYGSQRPKYPGHHETAHAKNRRADLLIR